MLTYENWGKIEYSLAEQKQIQAVEFLYKNPILKNEKIIFCSHDPVVTLGKQTLPQDIKRWDGAQFKVKRGGQATYHGPGQVIVYLILNLKKRGNDAIKLLRHLELSLVKTLQDYKLETRGNPDSTGVWFHEKKLASIGMAIKRGITYHGMAINLFLDPLAFQGIRPCGQDSHTMVSIEELILKKIDRDEFEQKLLKNIQQILSTNFPLDSNH